MSEDRCRKGRPFSVGDIVEPRYGRSLMTQIAPHTPAKPGGEWSVLASRKGEVVAVCQHAERVVVAWFDNGKVGAVLERALLSAEHAESPPPKGRELVE